MSPVQKAAWLGITALRCVGLAYWRAGFLH